MGNVSSLRTESGFTLIEVMIAIVIVTIGIFATMAMQITTVKGNSFANSLTRATLTGSGVVEVLKVKSYGNGVFDIGVHNEAELAGVILAPEIQGIQWTVAADNPNPLLATRKDVALVVSYKDNSFTKTNLLKALTLNFSKVRI